MSGKTRPQPPAASAAEQPPSEQQQEITRLQNAIFAKEQEVRRHTQAQSDAARLRRLAEKELNSLRSQMIALLTRGS